MISQLSVFLENKVGHLASACRVIADAGINMHAMFLAETKDYGVARIFCDTPGRAAAILSEAGYRAMLVPVIAVNVPNQPGGLANLLSFCQGAEMNIEYGYCFQVDGDTAIDVLKIDTEGAEEKLVEGGYKVLNAEEVYTVD